jgi:hypothetical protein
MARYTDPQQHFSVFYPDDWLPLTRENSPHVDFVSAATGGFLRVESRQFLHNVPAEQRPERFLETLIARENGGKNSFSVPPIEHFHRHGAEGVHVSYTLPRDFCTSDAEILRHVRVWVFTRGPIQVRCLYRCRAQQAGEDDAELESIVRSLEISAEPLLDFAAFARYYLTRLQRMGPRFANATLNGAVLRLPDGQLVSLDEVYDEFAQNPQNLDALIENHIEKLDFCGDDVPDLRDFHAVKSLLLPKLFRAAREPQPHRIPFWSGLEVGAIVCGNVFQYPVTGELLRAWNFESLVELHDLLVDNLYNLGPLHPHVLGNEDSGAALALVFDEHLLASSAVLYDDFYESCCDNLGCAEFLVGVPTHDFLTCFRADDTKFVLRHTADVRWNFHHRRHGLSDLVYAMHGPRVSDVTPHDIYAARSVSKLGATEN